MPIKDLEKQRKHNREYNRQDKRKKWREENRKYLNEIKREWGRTHRDSRRKTEQEWRKRNLEKYFAGNKFRGAIRQGKLILQKSKCIKCRSKKNLQFHHPDYKYPYTVEVLCGICHNKVHNRSSYKV